MRWCPPRGTDAGDAKSKRGFKGRMGSSWDSKAPGVTKHLKSRLALKVCELHAAPLGVGESRSPSGCSPLRGAAANRTAYLTHLPCSQLTHSSLFQEQEHFTRHKIAVCFSGLLNKSFSRKNRKPTLEESFPGTRQTCFFPPRALAGCKH